MDNTNHDLVHTLSVRLDARWHERDYQAEAACAECRHVFERLKELDDEAIRLLTGELTEHVRSGKFFAGQPEHLAL